jgi:hypothetical protein
MAEQAGGNAAPACGPPLHFAQGGGAQNSAMYDDIRIMFSHSLSEVYLHT